MDDESEEEEDGIPWCWKYVALVVINPFIGGMCLSYVWGPLALHWKANNWPAWHLGALSMLVVQLRTPAVQLLVSSGLWMTLVFVLVSFLVMLPSIFLPNEEWAAAVLVIVEAFELFVLYDAVSFVSFAETEMMAQQATAHTLQYFTLSSALAPTVGGATYILFGWQGIACLGAGLKFLQLVVLVTDSTVQGQVVHICLFLSGRFKDDLDDLIDDDGLPPTAPGQPATTERLSDASVNSGDPPFVGHNSSRSPKRELDESRMTPVLPGMPEPEEEDDFVRGRRPPPPPGLLRLGSAAPPEPARPRERRPDAPQVRASNSGLQEVPHVQDLMGEQFLCGTFATTMTNMTAATFHSYALAQVDAPASSLLPHTLTMMEEEDEDDEPKPAPKIPKDVIVPLLAILACSFAGMFAQSMCTLVASVVFQERFGLNAAISGAFRSAGGVGVFLGMALLPAGASDEERFQRGRAWRLLATILCKPYKLACVMAFWTLLSIGMAMPNVVVAATAQVSMGIANALMNRAVSEICLFFCLGDGGVFLKMQVRRTLSDAFGGGLACLLGPIVYDIFDAEGPFFMGAGLAAATCIIFVIVFCRRDGWGRSLEDAEARRARRNGLSRVSMWKTKKSVRSLKPPEEEDELEEEEEDA
ncbi:Uncharacterized protein SCF082_LOCUS33838 [Durusdinium trenchii]|uniref:Solute carrier family 40 protein n=2 Tax=Durusdinium trenchii TaxID=1381693 RepID=A0ABP0NSG5_9DINO